MRLPLAFAFASAFVIVACSSEDSAKVCSDYTPPASFDANTPPTSFSRDVYPLFTTCATNDCHGTPNNQNHVFIAQNDSRSTHPGLVNVKANKLPTMDYVKPGDPTNSFLMRKLDGSHCVLDKQCTGGTCGDTMPNKNQQLSVEERDKVRRWIAQGAKND
jgi:hypothetical protein